MSEHTHTHIHIQHAFTRLLFATLLPTGANDSKGVHPFACLMCLHRHLTRSTKNNFIQSSAVLRGGFFCPAENYRGREGGPVGGEGRGGGLADMPVCFGLLGLHHMLQTAQRPACKPTPKMQPPITNKAHKQRKMCQIQCSTESHLVVIALQL